MSERVHSRFLSMDTYRFIWIASLVFFAFYFVVFGLAVGKRPFVFDVNTGTQAGQVIPVTWNSKHAWAVQFFDQQGYLIGDDRVLDLQFSAYAGSANISTNTHSTTIVSIVVYNWFGLSVSQCIALNYT